MRRILYSTALCLLILQPLFPQSRQKGVSESAALTSQDFEHFTAADGMAQNTPFSLFQDRRGFLWIGTWHGLSRFDGYQFVNFRRDPRDRRSMSDNRVNSIIETRSGEIWLGTRNGLNKYDQVTNTFEAYHFAAGGNELGDSFIQTIFEDGEGMIWVGTSKYGLNRFDPANKTFTGYVNDPSDPASISGDSVFGIVEDASGNLWIGTSDGLNKFDRNSGRFSRYRSVKDDPKTLSDDRIRGLTRDRSGMIWIATANGLTSLDPVSQIFSRYLLSDNDVKSVYESRSGDIWIGTAKGLSRLYLKSGAIADYRYDIGNPSGITEGTVYSIIEDNNDQVWIGTEKGLSKLDQRTNRFRKYRHSTDPRSLGSDYVRTILEDNRQNVWVGTIDGLYFSRVGANGFELFKEIKDFVGILFQDIEGKIWIGTRSRLLSYDATRDKLSEFHYDPKKPGSIGVNTIYADRSGMFWLGLTTGELTRFDRTKGEFIGLRYGPNRVGNRSENRILDTLEDSEGMVWVGTRGGLYRLDPKTEDVKIFQHDPADPASLTASAVGAIYEDADRTLWFGTSSGGLNRFDRATSKFEHFTVREGMPIDNVYEILDDGRGNLWMSTDNGLAKFTPATRQFRNFDVNDGLTNDEFTDKAAFKNRNGEMYFGGIEGFVKFDPAELTQSTFIPPVYLTDVRVLEQPLTTLGNVSMLKELDLTSRDYVVSFDFAALDFAGSKKLQYQWKLDGFDPEWINGGTRRTATYSNLPGGDYVLKVKATNVDGIWGGESLNLIVRVQPPFYRTFWFAALVAGLLVLLVWMFYRYRIGQLRTVSEAQTRFTQQLITSQEAERKRIAAELHDGLGQNLVIIKNRAMLGLNKSDDKERLAKELGSISETASQALDEVREITNNLRPQLLDRLGLTKAIAAMLKKYSGVIDLQSDIDDVDGIFSEDQEISIYRIIQESVNNVIKHSNASTVSVKLKRLDGRVLVEINDNGKGFDRASLPAEKRGFGLTGLNERAQLLGGEFQIESNAGEGTRVSVSFPV